MWETKVGGLFIRRQPGELIRPPSQKQKRSIRPWAHASSGRMLASTVLVTIL
jgi:hypothetical protein